MSEQADRAVERITVAAIEVVRKKRTALAVALAETASAFHRAMRHKTSDWRGCGEKECARAWAALLANGEK